MTSDERAVAQIAVELLQANSVVEQGYQIALADSDEKLSLPCVVASASKEESEVLNLPQGWINRYKLSLELRGIRKQHPSDALDEAFAQIDAALFPSPVPSLRSASSVTYYMIDKQTGSDMKIGADDKTRTCEYDVFALAA